MRIHKATSNKEYEEKMIDNYKDEMKEMRKDVKTSRSDKFFDTKDF